MDLHNHCLRPSSLVTYGCSELKDSCHKKLIFQKILTLLTAFTLRAYHLSLLMKAGDGFS